MFVHPGAGQERRARPRVAALVAALWLVLGLALPAFAATTGPTKLSEASFSPSAPVPGAPITLAVTYRNREGSPPDYVRVVVGSVTHDLSNANGGDTWKTGVRYTLTMTLPAGTYPVRFEAMDRERFTDAIEIGPLVVAVPATPTPAPTATATPPPTPAPTATPRPTPIPTATPRPTPTPSASAAPTASASAAPVATPRPTPRPTASPRPTATAAPTAPPSAPTVPGASPASPAGSAPAPTGPAGAPAASGAAPTDGAAAPGAGVPGASTDPGSAGGAPGPSPDPDGNGAVPGPGAPGGNSGSGTSGGGSGSGSTGGGSGSSGDGGAPVLGEPDLSSWTLGSGDPWGGSSLEALVRVLPTMAATTSVVTLAMAFGLFGKRRRDGEPTAPDDVLSTAAASGSGAVATAALAARPVVVPDLEAHLPRWRRPSLLEARKADPLRQASTTVRLTFDQRTDATEGRERRLIRYRLVRLLDAPDELLGNEIGVLDEGDEVVPLLKRGAYWQVLCPDGRQGWIHKMTLGDVVIDAPSVSGGDSWTAGDRGRVADDVDDDVLRAFLESRRREEPGSI